MPTKPPSGPTSGPSPGAPQPPPRHGPCPHPHRVAIRSALLLEQLPARHRNDRPSARPRLEAGPEPPAPPRPPDPVARMLVRRAPPSASANTYAPRRDRFSLASSCALRTGGSGWRAKIKQHGPLRWESAISQHSATPRVGGRTPHVGNGAQRCQILHRLVGRAISADANGDRD